MYHWRWRELVRVVHPRACGWVGGACGPTRASESYWDGGRGRDRLCFSR